MSALLLMLLACSGDATYIVEGTVVEVRSPTRVVVDHKEVEGLMGPMVMSFDADDPGVFAGLERGDLIYARLAMRESGPVIVKVRETGHVSLADPEPAATMPVQPGTPFPATTLTLADGSTTTVGVGQDRPTLITFLYTTCPFPEMCPATVLRLQGLQAALTDAPGPRLLAVTLEPQTDSAEVLAAYGEEVGADAAHWQFARPDGDQLQGLARRSALQVMREDGQVVHGLRWLVLDSEGVLVERYDDNKFPADRVLEQLRTGKPAAPPNIVGTITGD